MSTRHLSNGANDVEGSRRIIQLDGYWHFKMDPKNIGRRREWFSGPLHRFSLMRVPACWNEEYPDYDRVAWYETEFQTEPGWKDQHVILRFDAVNYFAEVWVNGQHVGQHEGGYTPFEFDITDVLNPGETNRLTVRVVDTPKHDRLEGLTLKEVPCGKENWYQPFGGIWQSVRLVITGRIRIRDVFIRSLVAEGAVIVTAEVLNLLGNDVQARLRFTVKPVGVVYQVVEEEATDGQATDGQDLAGEECVETHLTPGPNMVTTGLKIASPELWSPERPFLYLLESEVMVEEKPFDRSLIRFGLREFTIRDNRFCLNGSPVFLKGALVQGYYPRTIAYPPNPECVRDEIRLAKEAGFNLLRLHIKTYPPIVMDMADEMGMLLYEEPPIGWLKDSPNLKARCITEVTEMVIRDRNHPSIVIWGMLNEGGTDDGTNHLYGVQFIKDELCRIARSLDPTRLIIDESGGVFGTNAYLPESFDKWPYDEEHLYRRVPVTEEIYEELRRVGEGNPVVLVSELGCGGLGDLPSIVAAYDLKKEAHRHDYRQQKGFLDSLEQGLSMRGLDALFEGVSGACRKTQKLQAEGVSAQIEAVRVNPNAGGYCLTQLADTHSELSMGLLDHWRRPKELWNAMKKVNQPVYLAVHATPHTGYLSEPLQLRVTLVDDNGGVAGVRESPFLMDLEILDAAGTVVHKEKRSISLRPVRVSSSRWDRVFEIEPIIRTTREACGAEGSFVAQVKLCPVENAGFSAVSSDCFWVFDRQKTVPPQAPFAVLDPEMAITPWIKQQGFHHRPLEQPLGAPGQERLVIVGGMADEWRYPYQAIPGLIWVREFVESGGTALILESFPMNFKNILFRNEFWVKECKGLLDGALHYAKNHPIIFRGLPAGPLGREYAYILPDQNLKEHNFPQETEVVAGSFTHEGAGFAFQATIVVVPEGKGRYILSQFKLSERLGQDPVADRLFCNLINFGLS